MPQAPAIGQDVTALMQAPPTGAPAVGEDVTHLMGAPVAAFKQTDTTPNDVDPNTLGTFVKHLGAQIDPIAAVKTIGSALIPAALGGTGPVATVKQIGAAQGALFDKAKTAYDKGDYLTAARHFVDYLIPIVGPALDRSSDLFQANKWAAGGGDALGLGLNMFGPAAVSRLAAAKYPLAIHPAASAPKPVAAPVQFAQDRGIPIDAATATDNLAVKGAQALADRSLGGSMVATPANAARADAMSRVGGELADETGAAVTTPEQAGTSLRQALEQKMAGHVATANDAYDSLRQLEQQPTNRMQMPIKPQAVDALAEGQAGQLRRIVHELDAAPFTPRLLRPSGVGGSMEHVEGTGGAGAKVFDDIVQRMGGTSTPTRGVIQNQLETYLGGGPETNAVKAAIEVATARSKAQGGFTVSKPELPASAMDVPTRLEAARVTSEDMGFPVDLSGPKQALRPLYEQMKRQMPITQQQANPGLKAIENVLQGPDYAPLSQIDRDLSAIKSVAREQGGLAKMAVSKLDEAVTTAAKNGGPDVFAALQKGRQATVAKYATSDVLDTLNAEPVKSISALTAPKDAAITKLRTIAQQVPQSTPEIARAYLEDLLDKPNKVAEWNKLGTQTKAILFPKAGQSQALDNFFALTDRISKTNINPSGSGHQAWMGAQGAMFWYDPIHAAQVQISGAAMSKLLRSPAAINALTRGLTLPVSAPAVVRTAATANLVRAAQSAGVTLDFPKAAEANQTPPPLGK